MKNILQVLVFSLLAVSVAVADPGDDLDFTIIKPKGVESPAPLVNEVEEGCYSNDPRINNLALLLNEIGVGKEIEPLKIKIGTFLEFSSAFIEKIGKKNIYIVTEDCSIYPTELDELPFKIAIDFGEIYNRLLAALADDDEIKAQFIVHNVISRPVDINGAVSLLGRNEIDRALAEKISRYTSARPVKDNERIQDVAEGKYKTFLIPLDLFRAMGGKVSGSELRVGLARFRVGACWGMDSSTFYTATGVESAGWLPGFLHKDEPYVRARSLLRSFDIEIAEIDCKQYLQQVGL